MTNRIAPRLAAAAASIVITFSLFTAVVSEATLPAAGQVLAQALVKPAV